MQHDIASERGRGQKWFELSNPAKHVRSLNHVVVLNSNLFYVGIDWRFHSIHFNARRALRDEYVEWDSGQQVDEKPAFEVVYCNARLVWDDLVILRNIGRASGLRYSWSPGSPTYKKLMNMSTMNMMSTMSSIILSGSFGQLKYEHVPVSSNTNAAEKGVKMAVYMTRINITQSHTAWNQVIWKNVTHTCVFTLNGE